MWSGILFVATTWIGFWTWIWSTRHCGLGQEVPCWFQFWEKLSWFGLNGLITLVLLTWKWVGLFLMKKHLLRCWDWSSPLNWIGVLTLSLAKSASKKIWAIISFLKSHYIKENVFLRWHNTCLKDICEQK